MHRIEIANDTVIAAAADETVGRPTHIRPTWEKKNIETKHVFALFYMFLTIQIQFATCTLYYKFGVRRWTMNDKREMRTQNVRAPFLIDIFFNTI